MFFKKRASISIVIPAYNHEKFISHALESVLNQTVKVSDVVIIDDGSTDNTGTIIKRYKDPRIRYVYQKNQDAFNALNRGLQLAKGDYIGILNSDDVFHETRIERLVDVLQQKKSVCTFSDVQPIDENGTSFTDPDFWWNIWHEKNRNFYFESQDIYTAFMKGNFMVSTSNLFLCREVLRKVGGFAPLRYLHDYDYIFRVMLSYPGKVTYLHNEKLLYYRLHGDNTLSEAAIVGREQDKAVIRKYLLEKLPISLRPLVAAATDRLVELEQELFQVRAQLKGG